MNKAGTLYRIIYQLFEHPLVFNLNQMILDGGKQRQIRRFLADAPFESSIDIGCGTGNWAKLGRARYLGVDSSPSFIAACQRRYAGDPGKRFVQADVSKLTLSEPYDLSMLISVLHHLSDDEARRLCEWVARNTRYFFVLDLYPVPWNPLSRWLYRMDRGEYIREPGQQQRLLMEGGRFRLLKQGSYFCPNGLYRHTLFLFESSAFPSAKT